jgi:hypothetical protein
MRRRRDKRPIAEFQLPIAELSEFAFPFLPKFNWKLAIGNAMKRLHP